MLRLAVAGLARLLVAPAELSRLTALALAVSALFLSPALPARAQAKEIASYQIAVKLDTEQKTLTGSEQITFLNDTANPTSDLYFHLYPNAFRSFDSTFMRENPEEAQRAIAQNNWGYMDLSTLRLASGQDLLAGATLDDTVLRVPLPAPLSPGQTIRMDAQFTVKLPQLIARMGYQGDQYTIAQWFPKLAVLTDNGWNAHQYHANSEFFADFGSYRVEITLPDRFVVGATGLPAGERENGDGSKTLTFQANSVHDFAWVANPQFREAWARAGNTDIRLLYLPEHEGVKQRFLDAAVAALTNFGSWYGPYPYARLTVADVPERAGAGMEYPTLVTVSQEAPAALGLLDIEQVTIHEIGHQWWYGMVATNEFEEAWMDEGFTTYSTRRLSDRLYGADRSMGDVFGLLIGQLAADRGQYLTVSKLDPPDQNAWDFYSSGSYAGNVYAKVDLILTTLERYLGPDQMATVMRLYFQRCAFHHPRTEDFLNVVREVAGTAYDSFFRQALYSSVLFDYSVEPPKVVLEGDGFRNSVTARRMEAGVMAVEVVTTFQDGHQEREWWDGEARWFRREYPSSSPAVKVEVDPDHRLALDTRWANNSYTVQYQTEPVLRRAADLLWMMQGWLRVLGAGF